MALDDLTRKQIVQQNVPTNVLSDFWRHAKTVNEATKQKGQFIKIYVRQN